MTYDEYTLKVRARMKKLVRAENMIKKYRFLIIAAVDILLVAFIFTMYFAGSYIKDLTVHNCVYGENGVVEATAFLSAVKYSYFDQGEEKNGLPVSAGTYEITAKTRNPFGVERTQSAVYTISKRKAFIKLSDFSTEYGDEPDIIGVVTSSDLAEGDTIVSAEIDYDRFEKTSHAVLKGVRIENRYGIDVTDSYDLSYGEAAANVLPRKITVDTASAEKKYDGTELSYAEYEITQGSLAYNDVIDAAFSASLTLPGVVSNKADIKIYDGNGVDISGKYSITERIGSLTVFPLEIKVKTGSAEKEYDGWPLKCEEFTVIKAELLDGHELKHSVFPTLTYPGTFSNNVLFYVTDKNGSEVKDIYDINVEKGKLIVNARKLTIRSGSAEYVYDGQNHSLDNDVRIVSGKLFTGDSITMASHAEAVFPGEYDNVITSSISGVNTKRAYDITYDTGKLVINKRPLTLYVKIWADMYKNKTRNKKVFTAELYGEVAKTDRLRTQILIPVDVPDEEFESYIQSYLIITHTEYGISSKLAYDITYELEYDKECLDELRKEAGLDPNDYQGGTGNGGSGGDSQQKGTSEITGPAVTEPAVTEPDIPAEEKYGPSGIGSGGIGGGINNSPSPYSDVPDKTPELDKTPVGTVNSLREGAVYLRLRSFGNYTGSGWSEPALYDKDTVTHPLNMTYTTLLGNGYEGLNEIEIVYNSNDGLAPVPYYSRATEYASSFTMTDVAVPKKDKYEGSFYYSQIPTLGINSLLSLDNTGAVDEDYKAFVYENYLSLPDETDIKIRKIIEEAGLDASSPTVISDVSDYVRHAAKYNGAFERIPDGEDRVIYFLTQSKEGICGHFASAATLIYRALGIPARYTVGYYVVTDGRYQTSEFYEKDAHAWVEVFVDQIGWIPVEVTAASVSGSGASSELQPPDKEAELFYNKLIYIMASKKKVFDGTPLYSDEAVLQPGSNLRDGDRIVAVTDSMKYAGKTKFKSKTFAVYDENGNDVTLLYDVSEAGYAYLEIEKLIIPLQELNIYVGQTVSVPSYENAVDEIAAALMNHGKISFDFSSNDSFALNEDGTVTGVSALAGQEFVCGFDVGSNSLKVIGASSYDGGYDIIVKQPVNVLPFENVRIKDEAPEKQDSKEIIRITGENGRIYSYISVRSADATREFNGEYLLTAGYEILSGSLMPDHRLEYESGSAQLYVGAADNLFSTLKIRDERGADVTGEYIIDFYPGKLTVTPGEYTVKNAEISARVDESLDLDGIVGVQSVKGVRVIYENTGDKPIVRVEDGVLIGIEPGVTHITAVFEGADLNGDGEQEYGSVSKTLTVNVSPKGQPENTWLYIVLAVSAAAAGFAVVFVSLKAAKIKADAAKKANDGE